MKHREFTFSCHDKKLYGQLWAPDLVNAVVVLVHGMGEHSGRYTSSVVPFFLNRNFAVVTFDHFGHGKSEGRRGHCPSYKALLDSAEEAIMKAKKEFPDRPVFLYGHSMGGNVVINYALRRNPDIVGVIATSPFLRLAFQPPKWKITMGKLLQKIMPSITLPTALDTKAISRDPEEVKKYEEDPLVHDKISPNFSFPVMEAAEWALENAPSLQKPILLLHGTGDKIIDHTATVEFAQKTQNATLQLFDNGYHELHNDLEKDRFLNVIADWIQSKLP
ncbi:lysophospholipase [Leptobacterium sp. I13]|uniref:alpha/beta hydrolase n=1 Tax=Leptobacterium meishanense TaxID=3128904 RepID=UPI0030ECFA16